MLLALLLSAGPVFSQTKNEKRLTGLEKRVTKVEKRVTKLEGGAAPSSAAPAAEKKLPENPVGVTFLKKKQIVGQEKLGIKLYMEFENRSNRRFFAFNGTLVFRDEAGAVIWSRPYGHSEPLGPGERVEVSMGILSDQAREYLRFVRAKAVTAALEKQEVYGVE
ncbi:MAG TPA: hypothetical protein DEQ38_01390 [Elusimicrobia bacterium]|nr:MAG: hypothetical protein A2089_10375 [Elusimicrobia bacterium GWD2_63_28]HCC46764.1 hypothetical protein [Elusimicrobiota bacterium]